MTVLKEGQKFSHVMTDSIQRRTILGEFYDTAFTILESMQLYNFFTARVSGISLLPVIKYTRLKPRLIENKFSQKDKINFLGHGTTLFTIISTSQRS